MRTTIILCAAGLALLSCNALQTQQVTLDITGSSTAVFTGFYATTTNGQNDISGTVPKSYTFEARKSYDIVTAQIIRAGTGQLTARLISGGVTRDSATTDDIVGTVSLTWTP